MATLVAKASVFPKSEKAITSNTASACVRDLIRKGRKAAKHTVLNAQSQVAHAGTGTSAHVVVNVIQMANAMSNQIPAIIRGISFFGEATKTMSAATPMITATGMLCMNENAMRCGVKRSTHT